MFSDIELDGLNAFVFLIYSSGFDVTVGTTCKVKDGDVFLKAFFLKKGKN